MKIEVDARLLGDGSHHRGKGEYARQLIRHLPLVAPEHDYELVVLAEPASPAALGLPPDGSVPWRVLGRERGRLRHRALARLGPRRLGGTGTTVHLATDPVVYGLASPPERTVAIVYDLIPLLFPRNYFHPPPFEPAIAWARRAAAALLERATYRANLRETAGARKIVAISESTKRDFAARFPSRARDVAVVPLAHDPAYGPARPGGDAALARLGVTRPYLLYVGAFDFRKNVAALVRAFGELRRRREDLRLVLAGEVLGREHPEHRTLASAITETGAPGDVLVTGTVSRDDLVHLYSGAEALVHPSLYEGFGLTVLEAMACGCPVVAYRTSSVPEVTGEAAMLVPQDADLARELDALLRDEERRRQLAEAGVARAALFSWERTARETLAVLEDAAR